MWMLIRSEPIDPEIWGLEPQVPPACVRRLFTWLKVWRLIIGHQTLYRHQYSRPT